MELVIALLERVANQPACAGACQALLPAAVPDCCWP
jgi:hypothetical protein